MKLALKPINQQVMVIAGASSGIGLVTAKIAARQGASVVLAARNEDDLRRAVEEIRRDGGIASYAVADVTDYAAVERIAETALQEYGRIDTWVNNAAAGLYGRAMVVSLEDMRRQFEVIYWGTVYGSRVAVPQLRERGGALINVASVLAERSVPLQANYCAAKHAVKAFTDALRMELEEEDAPISLTVVKPASIDTPLFEKSKSYLGVEPQPIPPVYAPEVVARTIIKCAQQPVRDVFAGGLGKVLSVSDNLAPRLIDRYLERTGFRKQMTVKPISPDRRDGLYEPVAYDGGERGRNWEGAVMNRSVYTQAALNPRMTALVAAGLGLAVWAGVQALRGATDIEEEDDYEDD